MAEVIMTTCVVLMTPSIEALSGKQSTEHQPTRVDKQHEQEIKYLSVKSLSRICLCHKT
jgi:hypothetical protein